MKISEESWNGYYNSYFFGEASGAKLISKLLDFAPGEEERKWVEIWAAEEKHHHVLWAELAKEKNIPIKNMPRNIDSLFKITENFVNKKDWTGAMVSATVIEHLSSASAGYLFKYADEDTQKIFKKIIADDLGHLNFDLVQLEKIAGTKEGRKEILTAHKAFLNELLDWPLREDLLDGELEILNDTYELHRSRLEKFGIKLPKIKFSNNFSFKLKRSLIKLIAHL